jgi:predicted phosphodiesterase
MDSLYQEAVELRKGGMRKDWIAQKLSLPRSLVRTWFTGESDPKYSDGVIKDATKVVEQATTVTQEQILKDKVRSLEASIKTAQKETLTEHYVREKIIGLSSQQPQPPNWLVKKTSSAGWQAVPTIFISDTHWGEVVEPSQVGGVNSYNLQIAHERMKALVETTINLLDIVNGDYPGIVVALGGDMLSGSIHDELTETNEQPIMPTFVDLYEKLIWTIKKFADEYRNVFVPCVTGNHSRTSHKPRAKMRNFTNYDWLLYTMLDKYFENDDRVVFQIPDGPDALFKIYNTRYLLTHGDQFRSTDNAMIGSLGAIVRGDYKKRSRNNQIDMGYDCMLMGHWHQLIQMQRIIVNGSLKGYCEYASSNNFGYEQPRQALWLTHPEHGIIASLPVNVDRHHDETKYVESEWISWKNP